MKKSFLFCLFFLTVCMAGLAFAQLPKYLYGIISFYSDDFAGKATASGEIYDPDQLTGAHQTLPFGTVLEVENLENGKKVQVRVNDRGPFTASRILDVSRKAADQLGFSKKGTVYSKITIVRIGDNKMKKPSSASSASSSSRESAAGDDAILPVSSASSKPVKVTASSSSAASSVQAKLNIVNRTNTSVLYQTNRVELTNYNDTFKTNIIEIQPYEEKYIESPVEDRKIPDVAAPKDDFILEEPVENIGVSGTAVKTVETNTRTPEPELPIPDEKAVTSPEHTFEKNPSATNDTAELVPDTLLPNEEALSVEKAESQGEALKETGGKNGRYVLQAGAFTSESHALRLYDTLKSRGFDVFTAEAKVHGKKWYRVRIGYFDNTGAAKTALDRLKTYKIKATLVKVK